jgi:hypothetical protein
MNCTAGSEHPIKVRSWAVETFKWTMSNWEIFKNLMLSLAAGKMRDTSWAAHTCRQWSCCLFVFHATNGK